MTLNANNIPGGNRQDPVEPGSYPARLVQVIDLGLQPQEYLGEEKPPKNEIMTTYELSDEFMKDDDGEEIKDKPRWLSETYPLNSLSSDRAKSTARYYALDPKGDSDGDWSQLLSNPVTVTVVNKAGTNKNKGKVFTNIASTSTMRPRDAAALPPLVNEPKSFDLGNPDVELFLTLPQWVQDKIKKGLEYEGSKLDDLLSKHKGKPPDKDDKKKAAPPADEAEAEADVGDGENW